MRQLLVFAVLFALGTFVLQIDKSVGQEPLKIPITKETKGLHIPLGTSFIEAIPAFEDYSDMMFQVCRAMELKVDGGECSIFPLMTTHLDGDALATIHDGNKVIVYGRTLSPTIGYLGAIGVIAHEVAHHYCEHLYKSPSPIQELEADRFSGAALRLAGYSLQDALAMTAILSKRPSISHPGSKDRALAITQGWHNPSTAKRCRN